MEAKEVARRIHEKLMRGGGTKGSLWCGTADQLIEIINEVKREVEEREAGLVAAAHTEEDLRRVLPCSECKGRGTLGFHSLRLGFRRIPCRHCKGMGCVLPPDAPEGLCDTVAAN